jgi:protein-tyrosine phosphatase
MAEFVMRDEVKRRGLDGVIEAYSSATSYEEYGNPVYPPAVSKMKREGVTIYPHRATPLQKEDYDKYDMFVGMEDYNLRRMKAIFGGDPDGKISKLLDYSDNPRDIADPWYSGNFDRTYLDVVEGVDGLLKFILQHKL